MRITTKIVSSFIFVLAFLSFGHAQKITTVRGHLCGSDSGMHAGTIYLRIGTTVIKIAHLFSAPPSMQRELRGAFTKYINSPDWNAIGSEFTVRYRHLNGQNEAISITFTGRSKKVKACSFDTDIKSDEDDSAASFTVDLGKNVQLELVLIKAGSFMMGGNRNDDEKPVHRVNITTPFYLGKYEVTQAQWKAIMGNKRGSISFTKCGGNCPADQVDWHEAQEFIKRLNARRDGYTYRLPSEAEWEYAARAGTTGDYAGNLAEMAWYGYDFSGTPHPVGQKKPNAWGLYDTHGNVYEWVQDKWHDDYNGAPTDGSAWMSGSNNNRILRGGSWYDNGFAGSCRSAYRNDLGSLRNAPGTFGFRLAVSVRRK